MPSSHHGLAARKSIIASPVGNSTTQPTTPIAHGLRNCQPVINQTGTINTHSTTDEAYTNKCGKTCKSAETVASNPTSNNINTAVISR